MHINPEPWYNKLVATGSGHTTQPDILVGHDTTTWLAGIWLPKVAGYS